MDFFSEIIGETVILGIDTLILGFCVKQLSKCKHILNALQVNLLSFVMTFGFYK